MRLEAMAVTLPDVAGHPNRSPFTGVLTLVDEPSTKPPSGARGHRVILTRGAAMAALPSLLGMAVDYAPSWDGHDARRKCGIITHADVEGSRLSVAGYLFAKDFPEVERQMRQCLPGAMGMSWELADAHVEDMRAEVWTLTQGDVYRRGHPFTREGRVSQHILRVGCLALPLDHHPPSPSKGVQAGATKHATGRLLDGAGAAFPRRETGKEPTWRYNQAKTWSR